MEQYIHKISGIYPDKTAAQKALDKLRSNGFPEQQLRIIGPHDVNAGAKLEPEGVEVAKEVFKDTLIGAGVGGALGLAGSAAMAVAQVSLFVTNPIMATLMISGYAATVAGVAGAAVGIKIRETDFLGVAEDALQKGYWVVVAHARDDKEHKLAHELIAATAAERAVGI